MTVLIFANGELKNAAAWVGPYLAQATAVIAADGGSNHLARLGIVPHVLIGDLDSTPPEMVAQLRQQGTAVFQHPRDKNETDLELALHYAATQFPQAEILLLGVLGGRLDQTLANILLLAHPMLAGRVVRLVDEVQSAWLVTDFTEIVGHVGDTVSLIPLGGAVHVDHTTHLRWPLQDEWLHFGPARGVSNQLTAERATVALLSGQLLCIKGSGREE